MLWKSFALAAPTSEDELSVTKPGRTTNQTGIIFIFTSQGAQYASMRHGVMQFPIFKAILAKPNEIFAELGCTWSPIVWGELKEAHNILRLEYSQALYTALQITLVELSKAVGITPSAVVGHSSRGNRGSATNTAIDTLKDKLDEDGTFAVKLKTGVTYHSHAMETISSDYLTLMGLLEPKS
ncbi:hypothetical protein HYALB_00011009 [Hymenoscyphus albidus]|uniref:Malonyl-CoA:ACP transacylase (MAT) domain-containing protein n=1 Tax=Hymenoscyphus albidus TaxID=595503 RepID=A0A9N9Q6K9_9HELO|nr:hypothetical protein HYALB_00011009 [Hymenoscyphus albidus]